MKKITIMFGLLFWGIQGFAQLSTNAQSVFKMFLFLDKKNNHYKGIDVKISKNDSLYQDFSNVIYLKLDTLKVIKNNLQDELTSPKYNFYELLIYDNAKKSYTDNVIYKRKLTLSEEQLFGVSIGDCDSYIIAINQSTGVGYRLKGFNINDFLAFLSDFKEEYNGQNGKELSTKGFLNAFKIEDIDFWCLYEGLTASKIDRSKYPCLKRVADVIPIH